MKKIHRIRPTLSTQEAALELRVSETTVKRLVRRGTLHTTKPKKFRGHWASFIIVDKAFREEQHRRMHGLKAPRRKHTPDTDSVQKEFERKAREKKMDEILVNWCEEDPSPIQTVTPPAEPQPAFIVNARGYLATWHLQQPTLFLTANKAIFDFNGDLDLVDRVAAHVDKTADYVSEQISSAEDIGTRCTAILATACILQLILAIYYTLCHFNII